MMTRPLTLRAARPDVWISEPAERRKPFLVGVEDRHQRDFGQVEAFAQQVDADQHVEHAAPQVAQDLDALERVDVGVQVADLDAELLVVRASGPRPSAWSASSPARARLARARSRISCSRSSTWPAHRPHLDRRIHQPGRPDDLLDDHAAAPSPARTGPGVADTKTTCRDALLPLLEVQRPVVERRRQPEAVRDQHFLARPVAVVHAADLRHGLVALVDDDQRVVGQVVEQRRRRLARRAAGQVPRVVLDAVAVADLA